LVGGDKLETTELRKKGLKGVYKSSAHPCLKGGKAKTLFIETKGGWKRKKKNKSSRPKEKSSVSENRPSKNSSRGRFWGKKGAEPLKMIRSASKG